MSEAREAGGLDGGRALGWELLAMVGGRPVVHALPSSGVAVLGRGGGADVAIDDPSVSRRHAAIHVDGADVAVEDLGSANGTRIVTVVADDQRTAQTLDRRLAPGEKVALPATGAVHVGSVVVLVRRRVAGERDAARASDGGAPGSDMVVASEAMRRVMSLLERIAQAPLSVLLVGETGVGKDVLARAIHAASPRRNGPFVAINCAALAEQLVESELFGHERGAFTGAAQGKIGLLEAASGGTAFLDEVGELPMAQQSKLLRVLEAREVLRVGGLKPRPIDVRFVAATNRDPARDADAGTFRRDLYFRLSGITLAVPPLRERREEIAPLADAFAARAADVLGRPSPRFDEAARDALLRHPFPGNVRELRNAIERAVALTVDGVIRVEHLLLDGANGSVLPAPATAATSPSKEAERQRIEAALAQCAGNQTRAAELLGISRRTLVSRIGELGIARPRGARG